MTVYFIGAGPGAPDLITVRGAELLRRCQTCLYAGSLVPTELLDRLPGDAVRIDTARMPLAEILDHLTAADAEGHDVARLHSGDLSIYSALTEQLRGLTERGIAYELVPGVPAFAAAAAALDTELTVPAVGQSLLITRVSTLSTDMPDGEDLASLARSGVTLALHLAAHRTDEIVEALTPHYGADCPTATVAFASRADEQIVRAPLSGLPAALADAGITKTAVIFVGRVLDPNPDSVSDSYLYSQARMSKIGRVGQYGLISGMADVLILGGTAEARSLARELTESGVEVISSLAGRVQNPRLPVGEVRVGGFGGVDGMTAWLIDHRIDAVVDATHPFAARITGNAQEACRRAGVPLLRLARPAWTAGPGDRWHSVPDIGAAAAALSERVAGSRRRRVFLTTGRQDVDAFAGVSDAWFLIRAVDPPTGPLPPHHEVLLSRGPYDLAAESALLRDHRIDVLVTKNSGGEMTRAKLQAAADAGIDVIMVERPVDPEGLAAVGTVGAASEWVRAR